MAMTGLSSCEDSSSDDEPVTAAIASDSDEEVVFSKPNVAGSAAVQRNEQEAQMAKVVAIAEKKGQGRVLVSWHSVSEGPFFFCFVEVELIDLCVDPPKLLLVSATQQNAPWELLRTVASCGFNPL